MNSVARSEYVYLCACSKQPSVCVFSPLPPFHGKAILITIPGISMRRRRGFSPAYCIMFWHLRSPCSFLLILTSWEIQKKKKKKTHAVVNKDLRFASSKFITGQSSCWPYLRCCCCLCLSCDVSLLCRDRGSGCRRWFWDGSFHHFLANDLMNERRRQDICNIFLFHIKIIRNIIYSTAYLYLACFAQLCCTASVLPSPLVLEEGWGAVSRGACPEALV